MCLVVAEVQGGVAEVGHDVEVVEAVLASSAARSDARPSAHPCADAWVRALSRCPRQRVRAVSLLVAPAARAVTSRVVPLSAP